MLIYQMRSSVPSVVAATQERLEMCMNSLKEVSKVWLVAKMVHTLFESILGNKMLEDKLQKAAGKKHKKPKIERQAQPDKDEQPKRKYDDMELGFSNGPPAPQVSYERSRPQTPAVTPSRDLGQQAPVSVAPMGAPPTAEAVRPNHDAFMGSSRTNTRPPTPFNGFNNNIPPTPPDLYLVTRDSPHISQQLWENFQPGYLFPESTNVASSMSYPGEQTLDPQLQMPPMQTSTMLQPSMQGQAPMHRSSMGGMQGMQQQSPQTWQGQFPGDGHSPEETWSNGSREQGPAVPTTLNMDDW